jgi:hypothetical protein
MHFHCQRNVRSLLGVSQHTIPASRAQSSKGHNIPCISRTPILDGKFLSKKCSSYTRKYGLSHVQHENQIKGLFAHSSNLQACLVLHRQKCAGVTKA